MIETKNAIITNATITESLDNMTHLEITGFVMFLLGYVSTYEPFVRNVPEEIFEHFYNEYKHIGES